MQNIVLTHDRATGLVDGSSVTIYGQLTEEIGLRPIKKYTIPDADNRSNVETRVIDIGKLETSFHIRGIVADSRNETNLNGAHNSSATTITVDSTSNFPSTGLFKLDEELISYTGITATTFTGCARGVEGTTASSHGDNTEVKIPAEQYRDDLLDIFRAGGAFQLAYRRLNWSCIVDRYRVAQTPHGEQSDDTVEVEFTASVGLDVVNQTQSANRETG